MKTTKIIPWQTAFISVDNTRTFEDVMLNELYVNGWENAVLWTLEAMKVVKKFWWLLYNVFEIHPIWHVSLAKNYKWKNPFDIITFEEVKMWDDKNNWLTDRAEFTVWELKAFLYAVGTQMLWPDHSIKWTEWVDLMFPLEPEMFDRTIIKWDLANREEYSWFTNWKLDQQLKKDNINTVILWWVATDYCVWDSALDAVKNGYVTFIVDEAVRWVNPETTIKKIEQLKNEWVIFVTIEQLKEILN